MTASGEQPRVRGERRIIERPRLIKLLDETDARTILLLAPAGYGKTTLARQWAKTLNSAIWISVTPAHRDVVTFAEDIADQIEALGGSGGFVSEYLKAQSNPQRSARDIAIRLSKQMNDLGVRWLILDDCHEVAEVAEACTIVSTLLERLDGRMVVASRARPSWIRSRHLVYGNVFLVDRTQLAMTEAETNELLGGRPALAELAARAAGWPAVVSLAAALENAKPPRGVFPAALHRYLAEELFHSASDQLRNDLIAVALLPRLDSRLLNVTFGDRQQEVMFEANRLGFVTDGALHPLLREFLLTKMLEEPDAIQRVRTTISTSVMEDEWEHALALVLRFNVVDQIEPVLTAAFTPLARRGLIGTLSSFAAQVRLAPTFPPAIVDLVDAEVALRDGNLELAVDLSDRAHTRLPSDHPLRSRASAIAGHGHFLLASYDEAENAFASAKEEAKEGRDEAEAIHGLAMTKVFGERAGAEPVLRLLGDLRHDSPTNLLRYATGELNRRRFYEGLSLPLGLDEALHTLPRADDPRARTSFTYSVAYALALRTDYERAETFMTLFFHDIHAFDLEFALPYANWTAAMIALGLRRFGEAERSLQAVEDASSRADEQRQAINARSLRARLLLQVGQPDDAYQHVRANADIQLIPSWLGEYLATRSLALACLERSAEAEAAASTALATSQAAEVRILATASRVINALGTDERHQTRFLFQQAAMLGVWDPVVCALRASPALAEAAASDNALRPELESLYQRSRDQALARKAGFRTRTHHSPNEILSPREREVLGLIARGLRNKEISEALFIADSTTKVHVRHILEKLGVRTRAEAVARYDMFATTESGGDSTPDAD